MPIERQPRKHTAHEKSPSVSKTEAAPKATAVWKNAESAAARIASLEAALNLAQSQRRELEIELRAKEKLLQHSALQHREEIQRLGFSFDAVRELVAERAQVQAEHPAGSSGDWLFPPSQQDSRVRTVPKEQIASARAAMQARNWKMAADGYLGLITADPTRAAFWVQYGHALKESGDRISARRAYFKALALRPEAPDVAIHLGHLLASDGDAEFALEIFLGGFATTPDDVSLRNLLEESGMDLAALPRSPYSPPARLKGWRKWLYNKQTMLARRTYQAGRWRLAHLQFAHIAGQHPWSLAVKLPMGHALVQMGDLRRAEKVYRECTLIQPLNSQAWFSLARTLSLQGNKDAARSLFMKAYKLDPENVLALHALDELGGTV